MFCRRPWEDATREIDDYAVQIRVLERESALGADHSERLALLTKQKAATEAILAGLQARWEKESALVTRIREVRGKLEGSTAAGSAQPQVQSVAVGAAQPQGQSAAPSVQNAAAAAALRDPGPRARHRAHAFRTAR